MHMRSMRRSQCRECDEVAMIRHRMSWTSALVRASSAHRRTFNLAVLIILSTLVLGANGLGSMSTIAAAYGEEGFLCAIEASRGQPILCWGQTAASQVSTFSTSMREPFLALSGGNGFMCGLKAQSLQPYCWQGNNTNQNLVPQLYQRTAYTDLAAGEYHVCGIRKAMGLDCWRIDGGGSARLNVSSTNLESLVAGRGFTCGIDKTRKAICWGEVNIGNPNGSSFESLAAGRDHVCGITSGARTVSCWGANSVGQANPPNGVAFVAITAGVFHSCGIMNSSHEVMCWGGLKNINRSTTVPLGTQFVALTAADNVTCGVRESNLLAVCWGDGVDYEPPLQLFSPGICRTGECGVSSFAFNLSVIDNTQPNICLETSQRICLPCAMSCPQGTFMSAPCSKGADRVCTDCAMCKNSVCQAVCELSNAESTAASSLDQSTIKMRAKVAVISISTAGGAALAILCVIFFFFKYHKKGRALSLWCGCKPRHSTENGLMQASSCATSMSGPTRKPSHELICTQAFRLTELRDATNGFKEVNELGRGSYGSVYKAILPDGRKVAVKRANAARRIHSNSRDFDAELEVLCKIRHAQLVNLVGYCEEMGERILVYEFMPNGTLHDHLHGGLAQLSWSRRFRIAVQAAKGIEYLHRDATPRVIHKDIKSSNILIDGDWNARVADFGLLHAGGIQVEIIKEDQLLKSPIHHFEVGPYTDPVFPKTQTFTDKSDVYSFGVVLFEILCGRRVHDNDYSPPNIVEWASKAVQQSKTTTILDQSLELPKHVEPILRVAEIAELCVRTLPEERPSISDVVLWLELVGRGSFM